MAKLRIFVAVIIVAGIAGWLGWSTLSAANSGPLRLAWSVDAGGSINLAPLVVGNKVIVIPKGGPLMALDASSGKEKWRYAPPEGVWDRSFGSDGERVFVCLRGGELAALESTDGALLWKIDLGIDCQRSPHVSEGILYVSTTFVGQGLPGNTLSGAKLYSITPADGKINWAFRSDNYILQTAHQNAGTVYVGGSYIDPAIQVDEGGPARFYALDSQTGKQKWVYESEDGFPKALYATEDRMVFIGYQDFLSALDTKDGKLSWKKDTGNWVPSLAGLGDVVYYGSANTKVHAWDMLDGKARWEFNIPGGSFNYLLIKPVFAEDRFYFMSQRGTVFALNLESGEELWSHPTEMDARAGLSVGERAVYMGDSAGTVYAYTVLR